MEQEEDLYNEEFNGYLKLAKTLIGQLKTSTDKSICLKWITKLMELKSTDPTVKKNRNQFFRYMLTVMYKSLDERPPEPGGYPQYRDKVSESMGGKSFLSRWAPNKKTYVAVKPLPGCGALVYMAVAKDPSLGWEYQTL